MKKLIFHIVALFLLIGSVNAQVLSPLGSGLPHAPELTVATGDGIAVCYIDGDQKVQLEVWNGDFWYKLIAPPLPNIGMNTFGLLELRDLTFHNGKLYLVAEHSLDLMADAPNYVLEWDGTEWDALEGTHLNNALEIDRLVLMGTQLQLIGIFESGNDHFNVLEYANDDWSLEGNLITRNIQNDNFKSVVQAYNKTYATGTFTQPSSGTVSLVEWDGEVWQNTSFPAFLDANSTLGTFNNDLVVYGNNTFNSESIKLRNGTSWQDISSGLDDLTIQDISAFRQVDETLYAIGSFEDSQQETYSLIKYENGGWETVEDITGVTSGEVIQGDLILTGSMHDNGRVAHIGKLHGQLAVVVARVFEDKDGDCVKDADEKYMAKYPMRFGLAEHLLTDEEGRVYVVVPQSTYNLNASAFQHWQPTCSDGSLNITASTSYSNLEYGVQRPAGIKDATINIIDNQSYRYEDGDYKRALVCVSNIGSEDIVDAVVTLSHGADLSNFSSERPYESYSNNTANWTISLTSDEELCFYIDYQLNGTETVAINAEIALEVNNTDADLGNNTAALKYQSGETLINEKHCNNGKVISEDEESMNYKIGFKNDGPAQAVDVKIVDELDEDIVPSSEGLYFSYSHNCKILPVTYTVLPNGKWQYKFVWEYSDINLSNANGSESEGFLDFEVFLSDGSLSEGTEICNTAKIYYSYRKGTFNEPITTNTVCSSVDDKESVDPIQGLDWLRLGPIPADQTLEVHNSSGNNVHLTITNVLGQEMRSVQLIPQSHETVEVSDLSPGIYFVHANGVFSQQIVIR